MLLASCAPVCPVPIPAMGLGTKSRGKRSRSQARHKDHARFRRFLHNYCYICLLNQKFLQYGKRRSA